MCWNRARVGRSGPDTTKTTMVLVGYAKGLSLEEIWYRSQERFYVQISVKK